MQIQEFPIKTMELEKKDVPLQPKIKKQ